MFVYAYIELNKPTEDNVTIVDSVKIYCVILFVKI